MMNLPPPYLPPNSGGQEPGVPTQRFLGPPVKKPPYWTPYQQPPNPMPPNPMPPQQAATGQMTPPATGTLPNQASTPYYAPPQPQNTNDVPPQPQPPQHNYRAGDMGDPRYDYTNGTRPFLNAVQALQNYQRTGGVAPRPLPGQQMQQNTQGMYANMFGAIMQNPNMTPEQRQAALANAQQQSNALQQFQQMSAQNAAVPTMHLVNGGQGAAPPAQAQMPYYQQPGGVSALMNYYRNQQQQPLPPGLNPNIQPVPGT